MPTGLWRFDDDDYGPLTIKDTYSWSRGCLQLRELTVGVRFHGQFKAVIACTVYSIIMSDKS